MSSESITLPFLFSLILLFLSHVSAAQTTVVNAAYWFPNGQAASAINSTLFTHLFCAFADLNPTTYQVAISSANSPQFSTFTQTVQQNNPNVKTLLSIGGVNSNPSTFAAMASQATRRKAFIDSSIKLARNYSFYGLELDWEFPNSTTEMTNFGSLLTEWRSAVANESSTSGKTALLLTAAVFRNADYYSIKYPVQAVSSSLDWINVMTRNYYGSSWAEGIKNTYPPAALYSDGSTSLFNGDGSTSLFNGDAGIVSWINTAGISTKKIVISLPFYGYAWRLLNPNNHGFFAPANGSAIGADGYQGYNQIRVLISRGFQTVYNATVVSNYCYNGTTWIGYDDTQSIGAKVSYAKGKSLLGYIALHTGADTTTWTLSQTAFSTWVLSRAAAEEEGGRQNKKQLLVIVLVTIVMFIILLGTIMCYMQRRVLKSIGIVGNIKRSVYRLLDIVPSTDSFDSNAPNLQVFSYATIKAATNNFSSKNKIGEGGFGPVYKGTLRKGQQIAVKRLSKTSHQGLEEFQNEVTLTATLHHVNLVRVLGYCTKREEKMLIYEYMPNKSLDLYLFDPSRRDLLHWEKRVHIIEGVIQGLLYLQEYSNSTIIHRDLKSSNILLDDKMNPKISDFGLARAFRKNELEANTGRIVGTYGYVPPEYVRRGIYSMKSDVYSFGVLLLQIISGKRSSCFYGIDGNLNLLDHAYELWKKGHGMDFVDSTLDDSTSSCKLLRCMGVALLCVQENPVDRPSMLEVSSMLKSESAAIISPKKPAFSVQKDEDEDHIYTFREEIYSVNDATMSEIVPR